MGWEELKERRQGAGTGGWCVRCRPCRLKQEVHAGWKDPPGPPRIPKLGGLFLRGFPIGHWFCFTASKVDPAGLRHCRRTPSRWTPHGLASSSHWVRGLGGRGFLGAPLKGGIRVQMGVACMVGRGGEGRGVREGRASMGQGSGSGAALQQAGKWGLFATHPPLLHTFLFCPDRHGGEPRGGG